LLATLLVVSVALPLTIDFLQRDNGDILKTSEDFETYIENNVKCAVYFKWQNTEWSNHKIIGYNHRATVYILNNGTKNLDKDLSIQITTSDSNVILKKPTDENTVSYLMDSFKPWIFGNNLSVSIIWNESIPSTTLEKKGSRSAIVNFLYDETITEDETYEIVNVSVKIDDLYDVNVHRIHWYIDLPSGNPKIWNIKDILYDINWNTYMIQ